MKNIIKMLTIISFATIAFAADLTNQCNSNDNSASAGMPMQSCIMNGLSNYAFTINDDLYTIDSYQSVTYKGETYSLRFYVTNASVAYNPIMAMTQNALAMRASLMIIYPNPAVTEVKSSGERNNVNCFTNRANDGTAAYMHCPIQAITIPGQN